MTKPSQNNKNAIRTRRIDRFWNIFIRIGGVSVVVAALGIFVFLVYTTAPLFTSKISSKMKSAEAPLFDFAQLDETNKFITIVNKQNGISTINLLPYTRTITTDSPDLPWSSFVVNRNKDSILALSTKGVFHAGRYELVDLPLDPLANTKKIKIEWTRGPEIPNGWELLDWDQFQTFGLSESKVIRILIKNKNQIRILYFPFSNDVSLESIGIPLPRSIETPGEIVNALFSDDKTKLYVATKDSGVFAFNLDMNQPELLSTYIFSEPISFMGYILGARTLILGGANGKLEAIDFARTQELEVHPHLRKIHTYPSIRGSIQGVNFPARDRRFIVWSSEMSAIYQATSEKLLWKGPGFKYVSFSQDGDLLLSTDGKINHLYEVELDHSETSFKTLFNKVQYEGYSKPEYIWQSSSSTDDSEPKFSLIPLIFGTLKGTLFALLFAAPIGILSALYTSQFSSHAYRNLIKPTIEMMAALPSVVLGFIGGLVLAPYLERSLTSLIIFVPLFILIFIILTPLWVLVPKPIKKRISSGSEFIFILPLLLIAMYASLRLAPFVEKSYFDSNIISAVNNMFGVQYDQRNALIVGLTLGFAVIPIIFTISEDAMISVPKSLTTASLACGASPWQTAWRVVLPSASPGIFSAIMIGFGRAVGETMIVLMAAGNTPIMEWSPFNGLRSLSANIAVEIPEAVRFGTHYRILFLSALILFIFTFILNSLAVFLSQKLRKKYELI